MRKLSFISIIFISFLLTFWGCSGMDSAEGEVGGFWSYEEGEVGDYWYYDISGDIDEIYSGETKSGYYESDYDYKEESVIYYIYYGEKGDEIEITLKSDYFDTFLNLIDNERLVLKFNDDYEYDTNSIIQHTLPYSGRYFIAVSHSPKSDMDMISGDYTIRLYSKNESVWGMSVEELKRASDAISVIKKYYEECIFYFRKYFKDETSEFQVAKELYDDAQDSFNKWLDATETLLNDAVYDSVNEDDMEKLARILEGAFITSRKFLNYVENLFDEEILDYGWKYSDLWSSHETISSAVEELYIKISQISDNDLKQELIDELTDLYEYWADLRFIDFNIIYYNISDNDSDETTIIVKSLEEGGEVGGFWSYMADSELNQLQYGDSLYDEYLLSYDDEWHDYVYYYFTGEEGDNIRITLEAWEFDPFLVLGLADEEDTLEFDDDGGEGTNSLIEYTLPQSGVYVIGVSCSPYAIGDVARYDYMISLNIV